MCSIKWVDNSTVVLLLSVGFEKNNLTSLLNILFSANHDLQQHISVSPPPPKNNRNKLQKHSKNEEPCRDGIPKKQSNKVETTPQYFYGLVSLHLLPFFQPYPVVLITWHDRKLVQHNCDVYSLWH